MVGPSSALGFEFSWQRDGLLFRGTAPKQCRIGSPSLGRSRADRLESDLVPSLNLSLDPEPAYAIVCTRDAGIRGSFSAFLDAEDL